MLCTQAGLSVQYTLDANDLQNFAITFISLVCACVVLAVGFAVLRSWSWSKRSASNGIGVVVLLKFVAYTAAALSNLWLLLTAGFSIWYYCLYKVCFYLCRICFTCNTLAPLPPGPRLVLAFRSQGQSNLYLVYPQLSIDGIISGFFYAAFCLKWIDLIHLLASQCTVDLFFIDWERNKLRSAADLPAPTAAAGAGDEQQPLQPPQKKNDVTFWRSAFCANEWNEICSYRKINVVCISIIVIGRPFAVMLAHVTQRCTQTFQLFAVLLFLYVIGIINTASTDSRFILFWGSDIYHPADSTLFRYAVIVIVYTIIGMCMCAVVLSRWLDKCGLMRCDVMCANAAFCQWGYRTFIYERMMEDKLGNFVDLCSLTNTSLFILSNYSYGYYIHGRSVHGDGDVGLRQLLLNLEKEKDNLVGMRGLAPGSDNQVYTMYVPVTLTDAIHRAYDEIGGGSAVAGVLLCTCSSTSTETSTCCTCCTAPSQEGTRTLSRAAPVSSAVSRRT